MTDRLFDAPPRTRRRAVSAGQPSWVATVGTRVLLMNAPDEETVRERIRTGFSVWLTDDEIVVRRATAADLELLDQADGGTRVRRSDWKYGLAER